MSTVTYTVEPYDFDKYVLRIKGYGNTLFFNDSDLEWLDEGGIPMINNKGYVVMPSDRNASIFYKTDEDGEALAKPSRFVETRRAEDRTDTTQEEIDAAIDESLASDLDFLNTL